MPKIISERCELVKLCHIKRSSTVFFETQCSHWHYWFFCRIRSLGRSDRPLLGNLRLRASILSQWGYSSYYYYYYFILFL